MKLRDALVVLTVLVVVSGALGTGLAWGPASALLVLAAGTTITIIWLFWVSLQSLTGETPLSLEEALSLGAPRPEEEQKRAALRALKDLEYERRVGKISEADFLRLSAHHRSEAKALLQALDANLGPARERARALFEARLKEATAPTHALETADTSTHPAPPICRTCATVNDLDARFCKGCGKVLESS